MDTAELLISEGEKLQIATTFLTALKSRDWELMNTVLTADCSWTLPGSSLLSGEAKGADAVIERARKLRDFGVMFELLHILYSLKGVEILIHNTAERDGLLLDEHVAIVMELQGTKILRLTTHLSDISGINQFFISEIID
jgi:ketosteroid isomerase-like protein